MTTTLTKRRIRLQVDEGSHTPLTNRLTSDAPIIWRGTAVDIEFGIFQYSDFVDDLAGITEIKLDIHIGRDRLGAAQVSKSLLAAELNSSLTLEEWQSDDADKVHGTFQLTNANTQLDLGAASDQQRQFFIVVYAEIASSANVTIGTANLTIEEDGAKNGIPPLTAPDQCNYKFSGNNIYLWNPDSELWYPIGIRGALGVEQVIHGDGVTL